MYKTDDDMKVSEKRTQMYFPKKLYAQLEVEARKEKKSVAFVLREAAAEYLSRKNKTVDWENDPFWKLAGLGESREGDWSEQHDTYLYGAGKKNKAKKDKS